MTPAEPDTESDIELSSALPKKKTHKKIPKSPTQDVLQHEPKKVSTKEMVLQALTDQHNRKGVSLHAIKKYMEEKYQVDTQKTAHYIKKFIRTAVEAGIIIQTKGVGASGSFKLAANKKEEKKKKVKPVKNTAAKEQPANKKTAKVDDEKVKKPSKATKVRDEVKIISEGKKKKSSKTIETKEPKKTKTKNLEKTPAKKKSAMMRRKSIGSIIKKPKMKPSKN